MKILFKSFLLLLPWIFKRALLQCFFGYKLHPNSHIGFSWVYPAMLDMDANSRIGHFNTVIHLDHVILEMNSTIGRGNWITGFSSKINSKHFSHLNTRKSEFHLYEGAAVTKNHHFDCTSPIHIGRFSTIAGYRSQFLTHSIDIYENRQHSEPLSIGDYCFVSTNVVILGGSILPNYSVLGANSLLNKVYIDSYTLYAGSPAVVIKKLPTDAKYFVRKEPYVW